jgi:C-terminal processing protease CtpA/Prc
VGIAAVLGMQPDGIIIRQVMPGGGAALAGIVPGDVILAVDGTGVEQMGFGDAVQLIRGPEGTVVVLTVKRGQDTVTIPVTRKKLGG